MTVLVGTNLRERHHFDRRHVTFLLHTIRNAAEPQKSARWNAHDAERGILGLAYPFDKLPPPAAGDRLGGRPHFARRLNQSQGPRRKLMHDEMIAFLSKAVRQRYQRVITHNFSSKWQRRRPMQRTFRLDEHGDWIEVDAAGRILESQQYERDRLKVRHKIRGCMARSFPRASGPPRF